jgi:hypothetical protein
VAVPGLLVDARHGGDGGGCHRTLLLMIGPGAGWLHQQRSAPSCSRGGGQYCEHPDRAVCASRTRPPSAINPRPRHRTRRFRGSTGWHRHERAGMHCA